MQSVFFQRQMKTLLNFKAIVYLCFANELNKSFRTLFI